MNKSLPFDVQVWPKVDRSNGPDSCWVWLAARGTGGYGLIKVAGRMRMAHRYVFENLVGPIPEGLQIDHLCRNRPCVNPAHLEAVTSRVNTLRGNTLQAENAAKTHCAQGHRFSPENTSISAIGQRKCRTCARRWSQNYRARKAIA